MRGVRGRLETWISGEQRDKTSLTPDCQAENKKGGVSYLGELLTGLSETLEVRRQFHLLPSYFTMLFASSSL